MRALPSVLVPLALVGVLAACATVPDGPSQLVLPGTGKSFDQFRADDATCRRFALEQVGGVTASAAGTDSAVASAAVGTAIGAAAGAAIDGSHGAAVGAGTGLLVGALSGWSYAYGSAWAVQQRYDIGYQQCMYAKGHKVPVSGRFASSTSSAPRGYYPPPPNATPPNVVRPR